MLVTQAVHVLNKLKRFVVFELFLLLTKFDMQLKILKTSKPFISVKLHNFHCYV